ncbi:MAG: lipopolysaccharide core heptose(II) kinase RfaY [Fulvivirga sp.]
MRILQYKDWRLLISDNLSDDEARSYFDVVKNNKFSLIESLKDHHRSVVKRIAIDDCDLVLKIPAEKNKRKWIRLLTWFRLGEAFKNMKGMVKLWSKGIKTTLPIIAAEKRSSGMVVDSWLIYKYLDGTTCLDHPEHYGAVVKKLSEMHTKNILHGDPQIRNFIHQKGEIFVIDSNPKSVGWAFDRAYEWAYLRKSAPGIEDHFGELNDWWLYKIAFWYDIYERRFVKNRRKFKNGIRSLFSSSK